MLKFITDHVRQIKDAMSAVDYVAISNAKTALTTNMLHGWPILTFGNDGSAAIAEHAATDMLKCIRKDCPQLYPWIMNLTSNVPLLTSVANTDGYESVFSKMIQWCPHVNALCIGLSVSGSAKNVVAGLKTARDRKYSTIALVAKDGGLIKKESLADNIIHVSTENYGIAESCYSIVFHAIIQKIRQESHND